MFKLRVFAGFMMLAMAAGAQGPGLRGRGPRMNPADPGRGVPGFEILGAQAGRPGPVVTGAPFSGEAVTDVTQTLPDGNKIHQATTTRIYRDSMGRTRREPGLSALGSPTPGGSTSQLAFINDPVAGTSHALDLVHHSATTTTLPQPPARGPRPDRSPRQQADSANVKTESLGRQLVSGVPADGTRTTMTIPAGQIGNAQAIQIVTEKWYSPELQMTVLSKRSDPRSGESVFQVNNLSRAEPPSTLFVVPGEYPVTQQPQRGMRMRGRGAAAPQ